MSHQVPTLFDIAFYIHQDLGEMFDGTATGGDATSLIDSELPDAFPNELDFKNGTAYITDSTDDAAPKGEMSKIASYDHSAGDLTLDDTLTATIGAGDTYAVADSRFPLEQVKSAINRAFVKIGNVYQIDTSLTTSGSLTRYTLPSGISERNLMRVFFRNSGTTDREEPTEVLNWRPTPDGELVFHTSLPTGKVLELHWNGPHARMEADSDALDPAIALDRIITEAVFILMDRRKRQTEGTDRQVVDDWNAAKLDVAEARRRFPVAVANPAARQVMTEWGRRRKYGKRGRRSSKYGPWLK